MPEIAEVARIVHFLRQSLIGKRIVSAAAIDDKNVFGKVGTSGAEVEKALKGKRILSAGSQGKYFWIILDSAPHLVMHFGMTGWIHFRGENTAYTNYNKKMKEGELANWPPKFWKFHFATDGNPGVEVAFTDPRRFGRVRLVDCPGDDIRKHSPLVENGPDPVVDKDRFTHDYLYTKMRNRHVPIKALLLDQTMISGIGNWVADETLYQAKLHPEQYCDDFSDAEIKTLYECIRYVCQTAVDKLGDSDQFPDHWLFNYRWGKGSKSEAKALPNGQKLAFIEVGGRTSCYAPAVQKKTGRLPANVKVEMIESGDKKSSPTSTKAGTAASKAKRSLDGETKKELGGKKVKMEDDDTPSAKKVKTTKRVQKGEAGTSRPLKVDVNGGTPDNSGLRRSTRLRK